MSDTAQTESHSIDALLPHLEDADPAVRQAAARALRGAKGEPARRALTALLKDSSPTVREAAEAALGPIVPIDVASGLVQDLQQEFPI